MDCRLLGNGMNPLQEMADHRHWVWAAKFSPHHSQMILSSSSGDLAWLDGRLTHE